MKFAGRLFEWFVNAICVVSFIVLAIMIAERYILRSPEAQNVAFEKGQKLSLSEVNWSRSDANLIMALSTTCHYCQESSEFYRALIASNTDNHFYPVVVFPLSEQKEEINIYLQSHGVRPANILQADFAKLGITGTPTLILVDSKGQVRTSWVGKLSSYQEQQVYKTLGLRAGNRTEIPTAMDESPAEAARDLVTPSEVARLMQENPDIHVIDIRGREKYKLGSVEGSLNIPMDELDARALHEVPKDSLTVIYSGDDSVCHPGATNQIAYNTWNGCSNAVQIMRYLGFSKVKGIEGTPH
jgi:rhodanese-related sulfurtransferase/thioredoxin-related protein